MALRIAGITALLVLFSAAPALAQLQGGNLNGTIRDEQGGVLPGATVTVVGSDRTLTFTTEADGQYRFLALPPGTYTVTAALEGFAPVTRENVTVTVGGNVNLPITMGVAAVEETVTVSGESPIIDTKQTGASTNFVADPVRSTARSSRTPT